MTPDAVASAYATLGLSRGCKPAEVKKTYRALVKRWHPDQYLADPVGQAEANERLRAINDAFRLVVEDLSALSPQPSTETAPRTPARAPGEPGRPLSREEIEEMVNAMRAESPVYAVLDGIGIAWRVVLALLVLVWIGGLRSASRLDLVAGLLGLALVFLLRMRTRAMGSSDTARGGESSPPASHAQ